MDCTAQEMKDGVILLARAVGLSKTYEVLLDRTVTPEIAKGIVYDLFVSNFSVLRCTDEEAFAWNLLEEYCRELKITGFVTFK